MLYVTLNGYLTSDGGVPCDVNFEWGLTPALGTLTPVQPGLHIGAHFSEVLVGLPQNTGFFYQARAQSGLGLVLGAVVAFTTIGLLPLPPVLLTPVVTFNRATLNALIAGDGDVDCIGSFEWGETLSYGNVTWLKYGLRTGQAWSAQLDNLDPDKIYFYKAVVTNETGAVYTAGTFYTARLPYFVTASNDLLLLLLEA